MTEDVWDLAVVGAGPAGTSAALAALRARPGARVLLLDRADFPRDKACGDGIPAHAVALLRDLGADGAVAGYRPVTAVHLRSPRGATASGPPGAATRVVPRRVFDARLVDAAVAAGAVLRRAAVRRVDAHGDRVVLDGAVAARVVVGADGAESVVRRALGAAPNTGHSLAVALRGYARVAADRPVEQRILMTERGWPAYAWEFPTGDGLANVGYGEVLHGANRPTRAGMRARLQELLPDLAVDPGTLRAARLPLSTSRPRQPDGRVLLAGDALSLVNPLTGEGIHYAVLSGSLAGAAAAGPGDPGRAHRRALAAALGRHLRDVGVVARAARAPAVVDAGLAAAGADPAVFADLVDLGLGTGGLSARTLRALLPRLLAPRRAA